MFDVFALLNEILRCLHLIGCTVMPLRTCIRMERKCVCVCVCSVTATTFSPQCCSAVIPESANPQGRKDPSNSENMNSPSDNLASQHSQELTGTIPVSVWCMVKQSLCLFSPSSSLLFFIGMVKTSFQRKLVCTHIQQCFLSPSYIGEKSAQIFASRAAILAKLL